MENEEKIEKLDTFEKLLAWQNARLLTKQIYQLTNSFPKDEQFGMTNQLRRASNSVGANIAEGFSRQSMPDKIHFYSIALGSLTEMQSFLYTAMDVNYVTEQQRLEVNDLAVTTNKLINGLIKSTRRRIK